MKKGRAVVVSDIPSLKEVCSDAALYINPNESESIKSGILELVNNTGLKEELKLKGRIRSSFFSWEESGVKVYNTIKNIKI
jgi:glycosyltransferase involved in cell wall biosynthesis